jgi:hypothetical protein
MPEILTVSGTLVDPMVMAAKDVSVRDIAHALSNLARWNGATLLHLSVAQHCVMASQLVAGDAQTRLAALFYNADEYLLASVPSPLKHHPLMAPYGLLTERVRQVIFDAVGIVSYDRDAVRLAHFSTTALECRDLTTLPGLLNAPDLPKKTLEPWKPSTARTRFLQQYTRLRRASVDAMDVANP